MIPTPNSCWLQLRSPVPRRAQEQHPTGFATELCLSRRQPGTTGEQLPQLVLPRREHTRREGIHSGPPSESVAELGTQPESSARSTDPASSSGEVGCVRGDCQVFSRLLQQFPKDRGCGRSPALVSQRTLCSRLHLRGQLFRKT